MYRALLLCLAVIVFFSCMNIFLALRVAPEVRHSNDRPTDTSSEHLSVSKFMTGLSQTAYIADDFPEFRDTYWRRHSCISCPGNKTLLKLSPANDSMYAESDSRVSQWLVRLPQF
jgi:hypothetical protein